MHDEHGKWISPEEVESARWQIAMHAREGQRADDKAYYLVQAWERAKQKQ